MENDIKKKERKNGRQTKKKSKKSKMISKKWKTNQSTKINLIGRDTIVNSPSYHLRQKCSSQGRKIKSAFKSIKVPREALKKENNVDSIMTELNTMVNGTSNEKERKLIQVVKNLTILNEELQVKCQLGEKQCEEKFNMKTHKPEYHGENSIQNDCETCERQLNAKSNLKSPKFEHYGDANIYTESFLSHHVEEDDDEHIELNSGLWDILLSETDESDLTDEGGIKTS